MEISAALVRDLRDKTGAGIMDCKKALKETGGDLDAAVDFLIPCTNKDAPDIRRAAQETLQILTGADATTREGWEAVREVIRDRPDWKDDSGKAGVPGPPHTAEAP